MIIDFHTHAFPDALAPKATAGLRKAVRSCGLGFEDVMYGDGTADGLIKLMDGAGVDISVLLPVATKPGQAEGINKWAQTLDRNRIIPFAAVYPDENILGTLESLAEQGYKGIKLHGEFQDFDADEPRMIELYRRCGELGLIAVLHAGVDCTFWQNVRVTPERMANVFDKVSGTKFVLAHMGGVMCEDRAAKLLAGAEGLWVDTAYSAGRFSPEKMRALIEAFGTDRVMLASDIPWNDPRDNIKLVRDCGLSEEDTNNILSGNACKLLGIDPGDK